MGFNMSGTESIIPIVLGGLIGGLLRGLMGIAKSLITKKEEQINYQYFFISLAVSGIVGLVAALMLPVDLKFAILAGYAGSDFLETLYKMKLKSKFEEELDKETEKTAGKEQSKFGKLIKQ